MTLKQEQQERWRQNTRVYRERHYERLRIERLAQYNPEKQRVYSERHRAKNPERVYELAKKRAFKRRDKALIYANKRAKERSEFLATYKLERGCVDCGYKAHPAALEFDHVGDKTAEVSSLRTCSMNRLMGEIQKCEVVCANCHRVRTATRLALRVAA